MMIDIFLYILFHYIAKRYCKMLLDIDGCKTLETIKDSSKANNNNSLALLCEMTLKIVEKNYSN
jgi:hypothetical protein